VYVLVDSKDLGLVNKKVEVGDIDEFDSGKFALTFTVPKGAVEKTYPLLFSVYNEDDDVFESEFDDEASVFTQILNVKENCASVGSASVTAELVSGGKAGKEMVVKAEITNTGTKTSEYTVSAEGFGQWASSGTLDFRTFTLNAGETKEVLVTLQVNKDASGENTFNVVVLSGNEIAVTQPVSVSIEAKSSLFSGLTGRIVGGDSDQMFLWAIGLLNVVLIGAIIAVAVRFFRK
ncbi:MAG TPA: putative S-layer protein, partial [Candidatus Nanoarchaeia archaeon]|nr:putative S-layer protein [Candidatus Nanoarchaeia archaeon]